MVHNIIQMAARLIVPEKETTYTTRPLSGYMVAILQHVTSSRINQIQRAAHLQPHTHRLLVVIQIRSWR